MSETEKRSNPKPYLIKLKGKDYLPVNARIHLFREECSIFDGWGIRTERIEGSLQDKFATFRAEVTDPAGRVVSVGTKTEDVAGFPDFMEKAETGSIGRALASAGFGTLFAQEFDEGTIRIADAPVESKGRTAAKAALQAAEKPLSLAPTEPVICSVCQDATKPVPSGRVSYCTQKGVPFTHFECSGKSG